MGELPQPNPGELITGEQPELQELPPASVSSPRLSEREQNFEQDVNGIYERFTGGGTHDWIIQWAIANHFGVKSPHELHFDLVPYIRAVATRAILDPELAPRVVFNACQLVRTDKTRQKTLGLSLLENNGEVIATYINQLGEKIEALPYDPAEEDFNPDQKNYLSPRKMALKNIGNLMNGLDDLVELGTSEQQESAKRYIADATSGLIRAMKSQVNDPESGGELENIRVAKLPLLYGSEEQREFSIDILAHANRQPPRQIIQWLEQQGGSFEDWKLGTFAHRILEEFCVERFGLSKHDYETASLAWAQTGSEKDKPMLYWQNIIAMRTLEEQRPGAVKELSDRFNIKVFARYPNSCLLSQLDMENAEPNQYYGLAVFPTADWNGAFYNSGPILKGINQYFTEQTGSPVLRIFECQNHRQALEALNRARKQYGSIGFAIVGGHGSKDSIRFGGEFENDRFEITSQDLEKYSAVASHFQSEGSQPLFIPGATIMLKSCSTGQEGGIAQKLSETFGVKTIGPNVPTAMKDVKISKNDDGYSFEVTYADEGSEQEYSNGLKQKV